MEGGDLGLSGFRSGRHAGTLKPESRPHKTLVTAAEPRIHLTLLSPDAWNAQ